MIQIPGLKLRPSRPLSQRGSRLYKGRQRRISLERLETRDLLAGLTFTANFTQYQAPSAAIEQQWNDFRAQLTPNQYSTITISGSLDPVGRTLTDPIIVPQIAAALQNAQNFHYFDGSHSWNVYNNCVSGQGAGFNADLSVYDYDATLVCQCPNSDAAIIRPGIRNSNWGGIDGATCNGPSQTLTLTFGISADTTVSLSAGNLLVEDVVPGGKNDNLTISNNGGTLTIRNPGVVIQTSIAGATGSGTDTVTIPLGSFGGDILVNTLSGDDVLTLDLTNDITRQVRYDGGLDDDLLNVTGGAFATGNHRLLSASSGEITAGPNSIHYMGLEPVNDNNAYVDLTFDFVGAVESIMLTDSGGADGKMTIDSTLSEAVTFNNPSNSLTIQTFNGSGADDVSLISFDNAFGGSLTVDGDGDDSVDFNANFTFAANRDVVADASSILVFGDIATTGVGMIDLQATRTVGIPAGGSLASAAGLIRLYGNRIGGPSPGDFTGVDVAGAVSSTGGNIDIRGRGGNFVGGYQHGVRVVAGGSIASGGPGTNTHLDGIGGASSGGVNFGVLLTGAGASVTSSGGAIEIDGVGGGVGAPGTHFGVAVEDGAVVSSGGMGLVDVMGTGGSGSSGGANGGVRVVDSGSRITSSGGNVQVVGIGASGSQGDGIDVLNGGEISAGGLGSVVVHGTGAAGTSNSNAGVFVGTANSQITSAGGTVTVVGQGGGVGSSGVNYGIQVWTGGIISAGAGGNVIVQGDGGGQTGNGNTGVVVYDSGVIETVSGNVSITGQGGGTGGSGGNYGVAISAGGTVQAGAAGTVDVIGTGGLGTGLFANHGVEVSVSSSSIQTAGGDIAITGTAGAGTTSIDLSMTGTGFVLAGGNGDVSIHANSVAITGTNSISAVDDMVNVLPRTGGTSVNLGGADAPGTLGLTDTELDRVFADQLNIGDAGTGGIQVSASISPAHVNTLNLTTGADLTDTNPGGTDIEVNNLAITTVTGIGSSDPLETNVALLAAQNSGSGDIQIDNAAGSLLAITMVAGVSGVSNTGPGSVRLTADDLDVQQPITTSIGDIELFGSSAPRTFALGSGADVKGSGITTGTAAFGLDDVELDLIVAGGQRRVIGNGSADQFNVNYGGGDTQPLHVLGLAGDDDFFVAPSNTMPIDLDGGTPSAPSLPGDTLHLDMSGAAPVVIVDTIGGYAISASTAVVTFFEMETLDLCDDSGDIDNADIGDLYVRTTNDRERITFTSWNDTGVKLRIDNFDTGSSTTFPQHFGLVAGQQLLSQLLVYAQDGDDLVSVAGHVVDVNLDPIPVEFHGEDGDDYLTGAGGDDVLVGGPGRDRLLGGDGNNVMYGDGDELGPDGIPLEAVTDGDDYVSGRDGNDVVFGGGGVDRLFGSGGQDYIHAGSGNDLVDGGLGDDVVIGADGDDNLSGNYGNDILLGGLGADQLFGRQGDDVLLGGNDADRVVGDAGNDLVVGGNASNVTDATSDAALRAILADWVANNPTVPAGLGTLQLDGVQDLLIGSQGADAFHSSALPELTDEDRVYDFLAADGDSLLP